MQDDRIVYKNLGQYDTALSGYLVGSNGEIVSKVSIVSMQPMKGSITHSGHLAVRINGKRYKVHRLVALAFVPNLKSYKLVHHKDGNKLNNSYSNLEWISQGMHNSLHHKGVSKQQSLGKLTQDEIRYIKDNYIPRNRNASVGYFAKKFGVSKPTILRAIHGND